VVLITFDTIYRQVRFLTLEKRYIILVALTIAMNMMAGLISWQGLREGDGFELNPSATFTPFGFFSRVLAILAVASMLLSDSEARRNIGMGMVLGAISADGIWDLFQLNAIFYRFEYLTFVGVIGTAAMVPTFVALVEVGRLTRQRDQPETAG